MLIRPADLDAIRAGHLDLAFRRWDRPRLRVGTRMRTPIGLVQATSVDQVTLEAISDAEVHRAGAGSREELFARLASHPERQVYRIGLRFAGPDPRIALREQAELTTQERAKVLRDLDRLDTTSRQGPWTRATLEVIDRLPATRAADLARELGRDLPAFKRDVRKLKSPGLTEPLDTGYRLSPRAHALIRRS
jgi:hypothetical protein